MIPSLLDRVAKVPMPGHALPLPGKSPCLAEEIRTSFGAMLATLPWLVWIIALAGVGEHAR